MFLYFVRNTSLQHLTHFLHTHIHTHQYHKYMFLVIYFHLFRIQEREREKRFIIKLFSGNFKLFVFLHSVLLLSLLLPLILGQTASHNGFYPSCCVTHASLPLFLLCAHPLSRESHLVTQQIHTFAIKTHCTSYVPVNAITIDFTLSCIFYRSSVLNGYFGNCNGPRMSALVVLHTVQRKKASHS